MKIGEVLELTQSQRLAEVARDHLDVGEKVARQALKNAGCYSESGKKGWHFDGDENVLEQSIYDYAPPKKINRTGKKAGGETSGENGKARANVGTKKQKELTHKETKALEAPKNVGRSKEKNGTTAQTNERKNVVRKRSSFDLDTDLMKELKIQAIMHDQNVYEMVETAIRQYLDDLKTKK